MTTNYISEDYCSKEIRSLLEENGYIGATNDYLDKDGLRVKEITLQSAIKWLREEHHIAISVYVFNRDVPLKENNIIYTCDIATANMSSKEGHLRLVGPYEEACEAAIKYCLENLI